MDEQKWVNTSDALLTHRLWSTPGWVGQFHFSPWPGTPSTPLWPPGPETWRVSVVPSYPPRNPLSRMKLEAQVGSRSWSVMISVLKQHIKTQYTSDSKTQEFGAWHCVRYPRERECERSKCVREGSCNWDRIVCACRRNPIPLAPNLACTVWSWVTMWPSPSTDCCLSLKYCIYG